MKRLLGGTKPAFEWEGSEGSWAPEREPAGSSRPWPPGDDSVRHTLGLFGKTEEVAVRTFWLC